MAVPGIFTSPSARRNILRVLIVVVVLQVIFSYFLPSNLDASLTKQTFDQKLEQPQGSDHLSHQNDKQVDSTVDKPPSAEDQAAAALSKVVNELHEEVTSHKSIKDEYEKIEKAGVDKSSSSSLLTDKTGASSPKPVSSTKAFFKTAIDIFLKNKPQGIADIELNGRAPSYYYVDIPNPTFTIEFLSQFLKISDEQVNELQKRHDQLKLDILSLDYPANTFEGKGIVMIGGGSFLGTALTSIRALRETGSKLPLQLMLTDREEYDADVCEKLLPKLNAKCLIMEELVGAEIFKSLNLQKYELKVLGLFLSSFEEALLLDADNLAVKSPDYILESKPYRKFGYIIWPDFWRQTISPLFYKIAGVQIGEPVRKDGVPPEDPSKPRAESQLSDLEGAIPDSTCEAGQLAINKRLHHRALLATVYYNLFGFKYYYWLLGQGAVGIGDKDTFIAGLTVFKEQYYFVKERPLLFGYDHAGGWQDTTMVQYDPEQDYEYYEAVTQYLLDNNLDSRVNLFLNWEYTRALKDKIHQVIQKTKPEVQFLHIHSPKFNALKNLKSNDYETDGQERRQFGAREKIKDQLPLDWELKMSRISQWLACDSEIIPKDWKETPREEICSRIQKHVDWLIETSDTPEMAVLQDLDV